MVVQKYEIIFECARYISYLQANNKVLDEFPYISDCFPKISEDFQNVVQSFSELFQTFPKTSEVCRRLPRKIRRCFDLISITLGLLRKIS